jgi:secondary thiamine-phosphate synthase enzyme
MQQAQHALSIDARGRGCYEITREVSGWVRDTGIRDGLLTLFVQHTSCSLMIQENADPGVLRDMEAFLARLVPDGDPLFRHTAEGDDDMPAHVRMALTQVSLTIPVRTGVPALGTWQGIFLYEHRRHPMRRRVLLHLTGI